MDAALHIALIDDSASDRLIFSSMIEQAMDDVQISTYPDAASFRGAADSHSFDCLIIDHQLPDCSGLELLQELRQDPRFELTPIIILTGLGSEATAVSAMKLGAADYIPKRDADELMLYRSIHLALEKRALQKQVDEQRRMLERQAVTDPLTGLGNRAAFNQRLDSLINASQRHERPFALFYIDLNKFKPVNDLFGHNAGDHVLVEIAKGLRTVFRNTDDVYRLGGDEFAMLAEPCPNAESTQQLAQRGLDLMLQPVEYDGEVCYQGGGSIGVPYFPQHGPKAKDLLATADAAMYEAKSAQSANHFVIAK